MFYSNPIKSARLIKKLIDHLRKYIYTYRKLVRTKSGHSGRPTRTPIPEAAARKWGYPNQAPGRMPIAD